MMQPEWHGGHHLRSIRVRLPLLFVIGALVPALLALLGLSFLLKDRMEPTLQQRVSDTTVIADNVFRQYSEDLLLKARLITASRQLSDHLLQKDKIALINQLSNLHQDLNLSIYDAGIEIFDASGRLAVSEPKRTSQQVPDTMIYTVLKRGEYKISTFFQQEQLIVSAALPLFHPGAATPVGVAALSYQVSHKLADEISKIAGAEVLFYTHDLGRAPRVLATTLDETSSSELVEKYVANNLHLVDAPDYLLAANKSSARNGDYYLATAIETREMLGVLNSLQLTLWLVIGVAVLLALVIAIMLSRRLVNKILYLVKAARKVENGELDTPIQLKSADELGSLANTLDSMREEIRSTLLQKEDMIARLTLRDQINNAIVRLSGTELLKEVLMVITESVGASEGSIMLSDASFSVLELKVVYKPDGGVEALHEEVRFRIGEGIAGMVAATGEATISNDPRKDKRFKTYRFQEVDDRLKNLLCVPLKVEDKVLGILSLDNKKGGFEEPDKEFVQSIANQVAIAIQNAELYERSITDGLTQLFIRRYFEDSLDQELKRSERFNMKTALLMFDIDHFKRFNDTYGHQVGDIVIKKVAAVAKVSIRDGVDMAARYGGEEFAVIMPDTDLDGAFAVGERIRRAVEESFHYHEGHHLKITVSLGCAEFPAQAVSKEALIMHADTALYASKRKGRNCTTKFSPDLAMLDEAQG